MAIDNTPFIKALENAPADSIVTVKTARRSRRYGSPAAAIRYMKANTYEATGVSVATEGIRNQDGTATIKGDGTVKVTGPLLTAELAKVAPLDPIAQGAAQRDALTHLVAEIGRTLDDEITELVLADQFSGTVEIIAFIQDIRQALKAIDDRVQFYVGQTWMDRTGVLPDGREYEVKRKMDRKAWKHEDWKHDARAAVAKAHVVEDAPGAKELARLLIVAMTDLQNFHGASAPKVTTMRKYELDPDEYCTTEKGGYGVRIIEKSADANV